MFPFSKKKPQIPKEVKEKTEQELIQNAQILVENDVADAVDDTTDTTTDDTTGTTTDDTGGKDEDCTTGDCVPNDEDESGTIVVEGIEFDKNLPLLCDPINYSLVTPNDSADLSLTELCNLPLPPCCKNPKYKIHTAPTGGGTVEILDEVAGTVRYTRNTDFFGRECFAILVSCSNSKYNRLLIVCVKSGACDCDVLEFTAVEGCSISGEIECNLPNATQPDAEVVYSVYTEGDGTLDLKPNGIFTFKFNEGVKETTLFINREQACDNCCIEVRMIATDACETEVQELETTYCDRNNLASIELEYPKVEESGCCSCPEYEVSLSEAGTVEYNEETNNYVYTPEFGFAGTVHFDWTLKCYNKSIVTVQSCVSVNEVDNSQWIENNTDKVVLLENFDLGVVGRCDKPTYTIQKITEGASATAITNDDGTATLTIVRQSETQEVSFELVRKCENTPASQYIMVVVSPDAPPVVEAVVEVSKAEQGTVSVSSDSTVLVDVKLQKTIDQLTIPSGYETEICVPFNQNLPFDSNGITVNVACQNIPTCCVGNSRWTILETTENGMLTILPDGTLNYVPDAGFEGTDCALVGFNCTHDSFYNGHRKVCFHIGAFTQECPCPTETHLVGDSETVTGILDCDFGQDDCCTTMFEIVQDATQGTFTIDTTGNWTYQANGLVFNDEVQVKMQCASKYCVITLTFTSEQCFKKTYTVSINSDESGVYETKALLTEEEIAEIRGSACCDREDTSIVEQAQNGTITIAEDGEIPYYTANEGFIGTDKATILLGCTNCPIEFTIEVNKCCDTQLIIATELEGLTAPKVITETYDCGNTTACCTATYEVMTDAQSGISIAIDNSLIQGNLTVIVPHDAPAGEYVFDVLTVYSGKKCPPTNCYGQVIIKVPETCTNGQVSINGDCYTLGNCDTETQLELCGVCFDIYVGQEINYTQTVLEGLVVPYNFGNYTPAELAVLGFQIFCQYLLPICTNCVVPEGFICINNIPFPTNAPSESWMAWDAINVPTADTCGGVCYPNSIMQNINGVLVCLPICDENTVVPEGVNLTCHNGVLWPFCPSTKVINTAKAEICFKVETENGFVGYQGSIGEYVQVCATFDVDGEGTLEEHCSDWFLNDQTIPAEDMFINFDDLGSGATLVSAKVNVSNDGNSIDDMVESPFLYYPSSICVNNNSNTIDLNTIDIGSNCLGNITYEVIEKAGVIDKEYITANNLTISSTDIDGSNDTAAVFYIKKYCDGALVGFIALFIDINPDIIVVTIVDVTSDKPPLIKFSDYDSDLENYQITVTHNDGTVDYDSGVQNGNPDNPYTDVTVLENGDTIRLNTTTPCGTTTDTMVVPSATITVSNASVVNNKGVDDYRVDLVLNIEHYDNLNESPAPTDVFIAKLTFFDETGTQMGGVYNFPIDDITESSTTGQLSLTNRGFANNQSFFVDVILCQTDGNGNAVIEQVTPDGDEWTASLPLTLTQQRQTGDNVISGQNTDASTDGSVLYRYTHIASDGVTTAFGDTSTPNGQAWTGVETSDTFANISFALGDYLIFETSEDNGTTWNSDIRRIATSNLAETEPTNANANYIVTATNQSEDTLHTLWKQTDFVWQIIVADGTYAGTYKDLPSTDNNAVDLSSLPTALQTIITSTGNNIIVDIDTLASSNVSVEITKTTNVYFDDVELSDVEVLNEEYAYASPSSSLLLAPKMEFDLANSNLIQADTQTGITLDLNFKYLGGVANATTFAWDIVANPSGGVQNAVFVPISSVDFIDQSTGINTANLILKDETAAGNVYILRLTVTDDLGNTASVKAYIFTEDTNVIVAIPQATYDLTGGTLTLINDDTYTGMGDYFQFNAPAMTLDTWYFDEDGDGTVEQTETVNPTNITTTYSTGTTIGKFMPNFNNNGVPNGFIEPLAQDVKVIIV